MFKLIIYFDKKKYINNNNINNNIMKICKIYHKQNKK